MSNQDNLIRKPSPFELRADYVPTGDQPEAIKALLKGIDEGKKAQVLLGVTGSGKTFTMANVIAGAQKPTLVLAHNKTLVAQLYQELKTFFPNNSVGYFVSYFDYYQPEAYIPSTDTYIEKDSMINETIDRMRHSATRSLLTRDDVIIVASVSCIYGIGSTDSYKEMSTYIEVGREIRRDSLLRQLIEGQYLRNDIAFERGTFRVRGDTVEIFSADQSAEAIRVSFFGDEIENIQVIDPLLGKVLDTLSQVTIWPATLFVASKERMQKALVTIENELEETLPRLKKKNKLLEEQRLEQRTRFDLEMLETTGMCKGIENYSRHLTGRSEGEPPPTLLDYFPKDFLMIIDESHQTVSQIAGMYRGDRARKEMLVEHGFRLPSALDNRPLRFDEFKEHMQNTIYVSATPREYELEACHGEVVEQLIRPTGLLDPVVEIRPVATQIDDVIHEARVCKSAGNRMLVTTLTKRMSEDITDYLVDVGIKAKYLHSDIDTIERTELLKELREGKFDVLVGINLLREGLDLPEVGLVAILDADKEGFLRSATGLIQTIGRAARNVSGKAILYADKMTDSIRKAVGETERRRQAQNSFNEAHGIEPQSINKPIGEMFAEFEEIKRNTKGRAKGKQQKPIAREVNAATVESELKDLRKSMKVAAKEHRFEDAATIRDQIKDLENFYMLA